MEYKYKKQLEEIEQETLAQQRRKEARDSKVETEPPSSPTDEPQSSSSTPKPWWQLW